jgi:hypothetical protein
VTSSPPAMDESTNRNWGYVPAALSLDPRRSMDVSVLFQPRQRPLRSTARASVLGDGLLERIRSTSLALLGLTAAIGLAMVALALNQGWPLVASSPIPGFGSRHQAVGDAAVVPTAKVQDGHQTASGPTKTGSRSSAVKPGSHPGGTVAPAVSRSPHSAGLVAAQGTLPGTDGGKPRSEAAPEPVPAPQQPDTVPAPANTPVPAVPASDSSSSSQGPVTESTPESPVLSQAPPPVDESADDHGHGHRFGRGGSHRDGHSRGEDDPVSSESSESPESVADPDESPPAEADLPEESRSGSPHESSWGHGGGHGYGHDRW